MASEAQIRANRLNAMKSTGPRSKAGREAASRNALSHGMTARQVVMFDETEEDFAAFHRDQRAALAPGDAVEEGLVERIILCGWRLRRAARAEAGIVNQSAASLRRSYPHSVHAGIGFGREAAALAALIRYEAAIGRTLQRAVAELERRQARRAGERVPPPIVITGEGADAIMQICETNPILPVAEQA